MIFASIFSKLEIIGLDQICILPGHYVPLKKKSIDKITKIGMLSSFFSALASNNNRQLV